MPKLIGECIAGVFIWAVVLMAMSLVFTYSWNTVAPVKFALPRVNALDSLCLLLCLWACGRMLGTGRRVLVTVKSE